MQHLAVFRNGAVGIGGVNVDLTLVNDQVIPSSGASKALMPWDARIRAAYATGVGINRPRIVSPSLRRLPFPQIRPVNVTIAPTTPLAIQLMDRPFAPNVLMNEEVNVQTSNTDAAAQAHNVYIWFEPMFTPAPPGPVWTVRGTAAITGAANQWDSGIITLEDQLPAGRYAIVGMDVWGANILAARLIFANGGPRPGIVTGQNVSTMMGNYWRHGEEGKLGDFSNTTLPQLELFKSAAGTTQEVFLDVVPIGPVTS